MTDTLFAILALDAPESEKARADHREGHLAHFKAHADRIAVAGPLTGESPGSLVIYRAESEDAVRTFITGDPFHPNGVWGSIQIFPFKASGGSWLK